MGLAGRKQKQRIDTDPRNQSWADDAARFGQNYLAKLGWDPSQGLGVSGDGRTSHIKVAQKLNLLGIGAGAKGEQDIAWKQNRDYEMLLKRLNEGLVDGEQGNQGDERDGGDEEGLKDEGRDRTKRKRGDDADATINDDDERKKRKKERKEKKKKGKEEKKDEEAEKAVSTEPLTSIPIIQAPIPRPMAHRARFLRSKQLASHSSTAVAEILGIACSSSATSSSSTPNPCSYPASLTSSSSATPFPPKSESPTPAPEATQELRTSSTSVADYFKEKLAARSKSHVAGPSPLFSSSAPANSTSTNVNVAEISNTGAEIEAPRGGLGLKASHGEVNGDNGEGGAPRLGLGMKFGSLMGGLAGLGPTSVPETRPVEKREKKKKKKRKDGASELIANNDSAKEVSVEVNDSLEEKRMKGLEKAERREKKRKEEEKKKKKRRGEEDASS